MIVFYRLFRFHRASGASFAHALKRAWAKTWKRDRFAIGTEPDAPRLRTVLVALFCAVAVTVAWLHVLSR